MYCGSTKAGMAHHFMGAESPVAIAVDSSGESNTTDSHEVGSSARR